MTTTTTAAESPGYSLVVVGLLTATDKTPHLHTRSKPCALQAVPYSLGCIRRSESSFSFYTFTTQVTASHTLRDFCSLTDTIAILVPLVPTLALFRTGKNNNNNNNKRKKKARKEKKCPNRYGTSYFSFLSPHVVHAWTAWLVDFCPCGTRPEFSALSIIFPAALC